MPTKMRFLCLMLCVAGLTAQTRAADPVVYYSFDTLGATVVDESGHGNDGVIHGGVGLTDDGYKKKCFSFNGSDSYVQLTRVIQDNFTLMAWIKTSTNGAAGTQAYQGSGVFWSDVGGTANDFVAAVLGTKWSFFAGNPDTSVVSKGDVVTGEWVYITAVRDTAAKTLSVYINGALDNSVAHSNTGPLNANANFVIGSNTLDSRYYTGLMDEVRIYDSALQEAEIKKIMRGEPVAFDPVPETEATDVPCDTTLAWTAGEFAVAHDVYLGTAFADVNDAGRGDATGVLVSQGQADASYEPSAPLEYGTTYYWRVDEVNGAPDHTIFKGDVWSFTTEPYAYPIKNITATASSFQNSMGPENTVNGSGLNANDQHSTTLADMWMTTGGKPAWIQYEFGQAYALHEMWVWNSNQAIEAFLGFGAKDVAIEYSLDGETWSTLENVPQFAKASGLATYEADTTVDFGGVQAKFVKLTINANWGGLAQTGLSEVRFFYVPVQAFEPQPADAATGVSVATDLAWRAGRGATSHTVSIGTDADNLGAGQTVTDDSYTPTLDLATTYYWKVDETGEAGTYAGSVWSFTTEEFVAVDDFEGYNDDDHRIYETWVDGLTTQASGSVVGYDEAPFAEKTLIHAGKQSMPLIYDNSTFSFSEAERTFSPPQDWTKYGVTTLTLSFRGQMSNSRNAVYVKINGKKISYDNGAAATTAYLWKTWSIPLASTGVNLKSVKTLAIGIEGSGSGALFIDDIRLYAVAPQIDTPADPGTTGLVALYAMDGNVQDGSGKNYHGTLKGDGSYEAGYAGQALAFNGINTYVELPIGTLMTSLTDTTIATHVHFAGGSSAWQRIFDLGSGTSAYMFLCPRQGTSGNMRFAIRSATVGEQLVNSPGPMTEDWHHTAVTLDSSTMTIKLYLDGELVGSGPTTILPKDMGVTTQNWLGRSQYIADGYFLGSLDDFRIYNRVLSQAELRYLAGDR